VCKYPGTCTYVYQERGDTFYHTASATATENSPKIFWGWFIRTLCYKQTPELQCIGFCAWEKTEEMDEPVQIDGSLHMLPAVYLVPKL